MTQTCPSAGIGEDELVDGAGDVPTVAPADAVEEPIGVGRGGEADAMGDGGREFETPSTGPQPAIRSALARHASARDRDPTPDSRCPSA
jgi:hypothetical protein